MSKKAEYKSVGRWFKEDLPEPYKAKAIKYASHWGTTSKKAKSLYEALKIGFVWGFTQEENDMPGYWTNLVNKIREKNEIKNIQKGKTK